MPVPKPLVPVVPPGLPSPLPAVPPPVVPEPTLPVPTTPGLPDGGIIAPVVLLAPLVFPNGVLFVPLVVALGWPTAPLPFDPAGVVLGTELPFAFGLA